MIMEKQRILQLVNKSLSSHTTPEEQLELQSLLQKKMGVSDTHKILLHLYNIQSLVSCSEEIRLQKIREDQQQPHKITANQTRQQKNRRSYLSPRFFLHNNLFQIYCSLTLRHLNRILC